MKYKKLYIWGPNQFNNRLLAEHIQSVTGMTPACLDETCEPTENNLRGGSLFFCDCDKTSARSYCRKIHRNGLVLTESPAIALHNVRNDHDLLEEIKKYPIHGIFFASDPFELIEKGIRKVLAGEYWMRRDLLVKSLQSTREVENRLKNLPGSSQLTSREQEILRLIVAGLSNQAIAERLFISPNTVKTHISNIYKKIEAVNRVQAILWAHESLPMATSQVDPGAATFSILNRMTDI